MLNCILQTVFHKCNPTCCKNVFFSYTVGLSIMRNQLGPSFKKCADNFQDTQDTNKKMCFYKMTED